MRKRVYVSGAYSGENVLSILRNIGRGEYYAGEIFKLGFAPFCPWHDKDYVIQNWYTDFLIDQFYDYCISWLAVSEIMFVVPGWTESRGTKKEIEIARELKIPIYFTLDQFENGHITPENIR